MLSLTSVWPYGLNFSRTSASSNATGDVPRRLAAAGHARTSNVVGRLPQRDLAHGKSRPRGLHGRTLAGTLRRTPGGNINAQDA